MTHECVLGCGKICDSSEAIFQGKWESLQSKPKAWTGLDKFVDVFDKMSCENRLDGYYVHKSCYITISSARYLLKAQQQKKKETDTALCSSQASSSDTCVDDPIFIFQ